MTFSWTCTPIGDGSGSYRSTCPALGVSHTRDTYEEARGAMLATFADIEEMGGGY